MTGRDEDRPATERVAPGDCTPDDADHVEELLRRAARAYFRATPSYRIRFEEDGRISICKKLYSFWGEADPAAATRWRVLSYHDDFEEAERRLRRIASPAVYYDSRARLAQAPPQPAENWGVPEDDN